MGIKENNLQLFVFNLVKGIKKHSTFMAINKKIMLGFQCISIFFSETLDLTSDFQL